MKPEGRALDQLAAAYALGALSPAATRRFEALLQRDIDVRRAWQRWEQHLSALTPDIPTVRPPDDGWTRIETRLRQKTAPRAKSSPLRWLLAAALIAGAAFVAMWWAVRR